MSCIAEGEARGETRFVERKDGTVRGRCAAAIFITRQVCRRLFDIFGVVAVIEVHGGFDTEILHRT